MSESDGLILGVDGGGTSTVAWLARADGAVLGRGKAGGSNARAVGDALARLALEEAIAAAFVDANCERTPVSVACLGLAGFDRPEERARLETWSRVSRWADRLVTANDGDLVVAAGTHGWGVGVIAGTGSIAVGRAQDGRKARAGGWGHLIGDEGSAYWVVIEALQYVARRADGRQRDFDVDLPDPLTECLCRALGVDSPALIPSRLYAPEMTRARIAAMAPEVLALDDPAIGGTLMVAGRWLAEMVMAVTRSLDLHYRRLPLALAGSFLLGSEPLREWLLRWLAEESYSVNVTLVPDPVAGALALAQRALRGEPT